MKPLKVAVIGGSAFSTPVMWEQLVRRNRIPCLDILLAGRNPARLNGVMRACRAIAPSEHHRISTGALDREATWKKIADAALILIQIRNGGYAGREFDESMPPRYGVPGDEGLGPGGLSAAIRNWRAIRPCLDRIQKKNPGAAILMISSPVGLLVRAATQAFPRLQLAGICELPWTTLQSVARFSRVPTSHLEFDYFGTNHLGWIYTARYRNRELLPYAVPLRYWRLHFQRASLAKEQQSESSRAAELSRISEAAHNAFKSGVARDIRQAIETRDAPWYTDAVAPFIEAFNGCHTDTPFFLSVRNGALDPGLDPDDVLEHPHSLSQGQLVPFSRSRDVPASIRELTTPFIRYERFASSALRSGRREDVCEALRQHPWCAQVDRLEAMAQEIVNRCAVEVAC